MSEQEDLNVLHLSPSQMKKILALLPPSYSVERLGHKRPRNAGKSRGGGRKKLNGYVFTDRDAGLKTGGAAAQK
jgi:hypothetical protein